MFKENLKRWLIDHLLITQATGEASDIHINELIKQEVKNKNEIFNNSLLVFKVLCKCIEEIEMKTVQAYVSIDLISDSFNFRGKPMVFSEIINDIDAFSIPSLILYQPVIDKHVPKNEFYRVPLYFDSNLMGQSNLMLLYKEYRDEYSLQEGLEYTREINLLPVHELP